MKIKEIRELSADEMDEMKKIFVFGVAIMPKAKEGYVDDFSVEIEASEQLIEAIGGIVGKEVFMDELSEFISEFYYVCEAFIGALREIKAEDKLNPRVILDVPEDHEDYLMFEFNLTLVQEENGMILGSHVSDIFHEYVGVICEGKEAHAEMMIKSLFDRLSETAVEKTPAFIHDKLLERMKLARMASNGIVQ